jgi:hypothetical protein
MGVMIGKMRTSGRRERTALGPSLKRTNGAESGLLLCPENRFLCRLGDSEFDDGLGWNLDLLLRLWIEASTRFPLLLYQLAKSRQDEFAVLFNLFVCERAERLEEYSSGSFVGFGGSSECDLKFSLGHVLAVAYGSAMAPFQENRSCRLERGPRLKPLKCNGFE